MDCIVKGIVTLVYHSAVLIGTEISNCVMQETVTMDQRNLSLGIATYQAISVKVKEVDYNYKVEMLNGSDLQAIALERKVKVLSSATYLERQVISLVELVN